MCLLSLITSIIHDTSILLINILYTFRYYVEGSISFGNVLQNESYDFIFHFFTQLLLLALRHDLRSLQCFVYQLFVLVYKVVH